MPRGMLDFYMDEAAQARLKKQLAVLMLPPDAKRKVVREMAMQVRKMSRRNVKQQRCVDGSPFAPRKPRKDGKSRRRQNQRMLKGLARLMSIDADRVGEGRVSWRNSYTAKIADKHQYGKKEKYAASGKQRKDADYTGKHKCERWLAKELVALGFRLMTNGKGGKIRRKRVSQKWIMQNIGQAEAVHLWVELSGYKPKKNWDIGVPARPFLGVNPREADAMLEKLGHEAMKKLRAKGKI